MLSRSMLTLVLIGTLAPGAFAQPSPQTAPLRPSAVPTTLALNGSDDCATPDPINGTGIFTFDCSLATTGSQGQNEALCIAPGIDTDVWFVWTAPTSGNATWSLCGGASWMDTKIAAYAGSSCPVQGTAIACNDDYCGIESRVTFPVFAGSNYMLQLGSFPGSGGTNGFFTLAIAPGAPNDECSGAFPISGTGAFPFDTTLASTSPQQGLACGTGTAQSDVWFDWTASASGTCTFSLCGGAGFDTLIAAYAGSSCPSAGSALGCNDDSACGSESSLDFACVAGNHYLLQLGAYATGSGAGTFTLNVAPPPPSFLCDPGTSGVIACPCANPPAGSGRGCDNSSGTGGASLAASGSAWLSNPTLAFTSADERPSATSILLQGTNSLAGGLAFGQGVRCVGGTLRRLYQKQAQAGSITAPDFGAGDASIPARSATLGDTIAPGQTRWYLVYYRDPIVLGGCGALATFNATNTAQVFWQP